jgi:hypothetical protein
LGRPGTATPACRCRWPERARAAAGSGSELGNALKSSVRFAIALIRDAPAIAAVALFVAFVVLWIDLGTSVEPARALPLLVEAVA